MQHVRAWCPWALSKLRTEVESIVNTLPTMTEAAIALGEAAPEIDGQDEIVVYM
jgi:hypothetical protein